MAGKCKEDPNKSQQEEIAQKKQAFLAYFRNWPVKKAAAEAVNRSPDTIDVWLRDDPDFSEAYLSARAEWAAKQSRKLDPNNLLINMYPEELKPPKQESESTVTIKEEKSLEELLAEARRQGIDTTPYEADRSPGQGGADVQDSAQAGA